MLTYVTIGLVQIQNLTDRDYLSTKQQKLQ